MDWSERIVSDPEVLVGKPTIKGTRLSVELILDRLADGWTENDLLESYPRLTKEDLQAVFAYLQECMQDGLLFNRDLATK
jgi:uncharacterized protein (DUF433 family)